MQLSQSQVTNSGGNHHGRGFLTLHTEDHFNSCLAEEILATANELEDEHVVCILDLCHLGGDKVEAVISKVYRVTEVSLD